MALKPSTPPIIFASLDEYDTDPLVPVVLQGTDTKDAPSGPRLVNGQIPNVPPFAQHENFIINLETLYSFWVHEGTDVKREDPHIVETDEVGHISLISGDFGDWSGITTFAMDIKPNLGGATVAGLRVHTSPDHANAVGAIFQDIVSPGDQRAVVVRCDGTSSIAPMIIDTGYDAGGGVGSRPGLEMVGANAAGTGLLSITPTTGTAIRLRHSGSALGGGAIDVETGGSGTPINATQTSGINPAIRAAGFNGGSNRSSPIVFIPQAYDTAGSGAQTGSMWVHEFDDGVTTHYSPRVRLRQTRYINFGRFALCHARGDRIPSLISNADINIYTTMFSASFPDDLVPSEIVTVRINLKGEVQRSDSSNTHNAVNGVQFQVVDFTDSESEVYALSRDLSPVFVSTPDDNNKIWKSFNITYDYVLPTAGPRQFDFRFRKRDSGGGLLNVRNVFGTVDTLP